MTAAHGLVALAGLLTTGLLARVLSQVVGAPEVLLLVAAGVLAGPQGIGLVDVPLEALGAQLVFTIGVSAILFNGGLCLSAAVLARVRTSLLLLAVPGVVVTAVVVGITAHLALDVPIAEGMLVGAVLSPTDPAILIPLFIGSRMRPKLAQTIVAESAINDSTGAILTLALAGAVLGHAPSLLAPAADFAFQVASSVLVGALIGVVLAVSISSRAAGVWRDSAPVAMLGAVVLAYVSLDFAGGSGYLGAFVAGLVVGNAPTLGLGTHADHDRDTRFFAAAIADLVTILVFMILGANLPVGDLAHDVWPAFAIVASLVVVARPLTVLVSTLPDRRAGWTRQEIAYLCWTRETGVVPAALVGVLAGLGVPDTDALATVVTLAILMTLVLQALPALWLAGRLGLLEDPG